MLLSELYLITKNGEKALITCEIVYALASPSEHNYYLKDRGLANARNNNNEVAIEDFTKIISDDNNLKLELVQWVKILEKSKSLFNKEFIDSFKKDYF